MDADSYQFCGETALRARALGYICHTYIMGQGDGEIRRYEFVSADGHRVIGEWDKDARNALESTCKAFQHSIK